METSNITSNFAEFIMNKMLEIIKDEGIADVDKIGNQERKELRDLTRKDFLEKIYSFIVCFMDTFTHNFSDKMNDKNIDTLNKGKERIKDFFVNDIFHNFLRQNSIVLNSSILSNKVENKDYDSPHLER